MSTRVRTARERWHARALARSGSVERLEHSRRDRLRLRVDENAHLVRQHLRVRPDPRGDQRLAARELLVDLERRVRPVIAAREDIARVACKRRASVLLHLPGEDAAPAEPQRSAQARCIFDLLWAPPTSSRRASGRFLCDASQTPMTRVRCPDRARTCRRTAIDAAPRRELEPGSSPAPEAEAGFGRLGRAQPHVIEDRVLDQEMALMGSLRAPAHSRAGPGRS